MCVVHQGDLGQEGLLGHGTFHVVADCATGNDVARLVSTGAVDTIDSNSFVRCRGLLAVVACLSDEHFKKRKVQRHRDAPLLRLFEELSPAILWIVQSSLMFCELRLLGGVWRGRQGTAGLGPSDFMGRRRCTSDGLA